MAGKQKANGKNGRAAKVAARRIFLLSPANAGGERAKIVLSDRAEFPLARRLRTEGAPLGEVFSFISGLYFRGKLAYATVFAEVPAGMFGSFVITAGRGLLPPEQIVTLADLQKIAAVPVESRDPRYRRPLERDARMLAELVAPDCRFVLLGSIATPKYVEPLLEIFGERLLFPIEFVGRGDMSRGGLMLRCARDGKQLSYVPVAGAPRHGQRPAKLPRVRGYAAG